MGIATTLADYLSDHNVAYDLVRHPHTQTALGSAAASGVPANRVVKAVVLKGDDGFMLALVPASCHIRFEQLREVLRKDVDLANEEQVETLFLDCEPDSVPALGAAYGLKVVVDDSLAQESEVYFESGDHTSLVHISGKKFRELVMGAQHGCFARPD